MFKRIAWGFIMIWGICGLGMEWSARPSEAFELKGFSDITYTKSSAENQVGGVALGALDFYVSQSLSDRIDVLVELVIEFNPSSGENVVDLERLQIGYDFGDALYLRAGRFHNILGYWNTAYHHGVQLQTPISRPEILVFEDDSGILPVHLAGFWVGGRAHSGVGALEYGLMVGNGSKISFAEADPASGTLDPNNGGDNSENKAVSFNVTLQPSSVEGLGVGVSGNIGRVTDGSPGTPPRVDVDQTILGGHLTYFGTHLELIGEYYSIEDKNKLASGGDFSSSGYFVQAGYRFLDRVTPYARYEQIRLADADPFLQALGNNTRDSKRHTAGARYDLNYLTSLRLEARSIDPEGADSVREYAAQWAFSF